MREPDADRPEGATTAPRSPHVFVAPVVRLRPIRTLVIARDLAFRQRAMTVLVELGFVAFAVVSLDTPDDVLALVRQQRADVVVLDSTGCAAPAVARVVSELCAAAPRVGVVVVSDHADRPSPVLPTLPKWGWAADLSRAVGRAYGAGNPLKEDLSDVRT